MWIIKFLCAGCVCCLCQYIANALKILTFPRNSFIDEILLKKGEGEGYKIKEAGLDSFDRNICESRFTQLSNDPEND